MKEKENVESRLMRSILVGTAETTNRRSFFSRIAKFGFGALAAIAVGGGFKEAKAEPCPKCGRGLTSTGCTNTGECGNYPATGAHGEPCTEQWCRFNCNPSSGACFCNFVVDSDCSYQV